MRRYARRPAFLFALCAVLCLALSVAAVFAHPASAFADDSVPVNDDPENTVNVHQLPDSSFIYDASIVDLAGADSYYNNQIVQVTGEVVGDRINADADADHCWITLRSQVSRVNATVSVYMSHTAADVIESYGAYERIGDTLQVRGIFHLACSEHEGVTDLHAEYVNVVKKGYSTHKAFALEGFLPGLIVVIAGIVCVLAYGRLRERRR